MSDTSTQVTCFVLCKVEGDTDDRYTTVVQAYAHKADADRDCKIKTYSVVRANAMLDVVLHMLKPWQEAHPNPSRRISCSLEDGDAYRALEYAELARLDALTGYDKVREEVYGPNGSGYEGLSYFVSEVPFTSR